MNNKTDFTKKCPNCNIDLYYKTKKTLTISIKNNTVCYKCANAGENNPRFGIEPTKETKEKLKVSMTGKKRKIETIEKHKQNYKNGKGLSKTNKLKGENHPNFGIKRSEEHKKILSKLKKGVPLTDEHKKAISNGQMGFKHSNETKRKQRIAKIEYIINENNSIAPRYNNKACNLFIMLEKENNWNGFYATKNKEFLIRELGYFLDYYEPNLNIVIEYDESLHYNIDGSLKQKDINRMNEIKEFLKCRFFRFNELTGKLTEY